MDNLIIEENAFQTFTFTIKSLGSELDGEYGDFLDLLEKYNIKTHFKYGERDPKGKFHYHGLIDIPKGFFRKKLVTKGNHLHLVEWNGSDKWEKYCKKDQLVKKRFNKYF